MKAKRFLSTFLLLFFILVSLGACGNNANSVVQPTSVEQNVATPDTKTNADNLVGSWVDITSAGRFVKITKTASGYQYEDNEGKLPATFKDGVLKVQASDTETADVYIVKETGHLLSVYGDNQSEYKRK